MQSPDGSVRGDAAFSSGLGEICGNGVDDDGDGAVDCRDPECSAPPLEAGTSFVDANRYLYTGSAACPDALQTGVQPDAIEDRSFSVVRGRVFDRDTGSAIAGARVFVDGDRGVGETLTRGDGLFDLAVNAGTAVLVSVTMDGFVPVQRSLAIPPNDYAWAGDLAMTRLDGVSTVVRMGADATQIHQGSVVTDDDGTRRCTVVFPGRVDAQIVARDGTERSASQLTLRATELTVGPRGQDAMPGLLPDASAYTYAVEISADEADLQTESITLSRRVSLFVENFLEFPVGGIAPLGSYDRALGEWVPERNGRIVRVVAHRGDDVLVDADGDGSEDGTVPEGARRGLARLYPVGTELMWVEVDHFTPHDINWPWGPPDGAISPSERARRERACRRGGSIIECDTQVLGETIPLVGGGGALYYSTNRAPGRRDAQRIEVPVDVGDEVSGLIREIQVTVDVAGQHIGPLVFEPQPAGALVRLVEWDGLDGAGRPVPGTAIATVTIGYAYAAAYREPSSGGTAFAQPGTSLFLDASTRFPVVLRRRYEVRMGIIDARIHGLGGWTLGAHHYYDRPSRSLWLGTGEIRDLRPIGTRVRWAATRSLISGFILPIGPETYLATVRGSIVERHGDFESAFAGNGDLSASTGDEGPATSASFSYGIGTLARGPDGSVYITDIGNPFGGGSCIRRVDTAGIIHAFAGRCGESGSDGDGGPAVAARFGVITAVAVLGDGSVAIADSTAGHVRRVRLDGIIERYAGGGAGFRDGARATDIAFNILTALATDIDGSLLVGDLTRVSRIVDTADGPVARGVAGGAERAFAGDGGPAASARLDGVWSICVMPGGEICIADQGNERLRCIVGGGRGIDTVVGGGTTPPTDTGYLDGIPATEADLTGITSIAYAGDGSLWISLGGLTFRTTPLFFLRRDGLTQIPSEDGSEFYLFDESGRHVRTLDTVLGRPVLSFEYDDTYQLARVIDDDGLTLTIGHDGDGQPTSITGPFGHRHALAVDANGWLASVTDPLDATWSLTSDPNGFLRSFTALDDATTTFEYEYGRLTVDRGPEGATTRLDHEATRLGARVTVTGSRPGQREVYITEAGVGPEDDHSIESSGTGLVSALVEPGDERHITLPSGTEIWERTAADPRLGPAAPFITQRRIRLPSGREWTTFERRNVAPDDDGETATLPVASTSIGSGSRALTASWDPLTRTATTTMPSSRTSTTVLDDRGRVLEEHSPGLATAYYVYDADGFLTEVRHGDGPMARTWGFTYESGLLATTTDPLMRTTRVSHDAAARPETVTANDGRELALGYDAMDRTTSITPPGRDAYGFTYSGIGAMETATLPTGADPTTTRTVSHDLEGAPDTLVHASGVSVDYDRSDVDGRLEAVHLGRGSFSNRYADTGLLESSIAPDGQRLSYEYDGEALEALHVAGGPAAADIDFEYSPDSPNMVAWSIAGVRVPVARNEDGNAISLGGLTIGRSSITGAATSTTLGVVTSTHAYTELGEPDTRQFAAGAATLFDFAVLARDAVGRMTSVRETVQGVTHTYDYHFNSADALDEVRRDGTVVETYGYHANRSRTSFLRDGIPGAASIDVDERMLAHGEETFEYRSDGALAARVSSAGRTEYTYDEAGSLEAVALPSGRRIDYVLDPLGARVGRRVDGVLERAWIFGAGVTPVAEADATGRVNTVFVHGPTSLMAPEMMIRDGVSYRFVTDVRGSVRLVVDSRDGSVVQAIDYDTFGRVTRDTNPGFQPFGFAGGIYDPDTHLVRFGARDYDPELGRFLTRDPSGFAGGLNAYDYAGQDPVNAIDPNGEFVMVIVVAVLVSAGFAAVDSLWQWARHGVHPFSCAARRRFVREFVINFTIEVVTLGFGELFLLARPTGRLFEAGLAGACRGGVCHPPCSFGGETYVETDAGPVPIAQIAPGDLVWALDDETGEWGYHVVEGVTSHEGHASTIELIDDEAGVTEALTVTENHPFYERDRGWVQVGDLLPGDEVFTSRGGWARIGNSTWAEAPQLLYDLAVEGAETYFVGETGSWVHNCPPVGEEATRRLASLGDMQFRTQADALAEALSRHGIDPTTAEARAMYGSNPSLLGPKGEPWAIVRGLDADANLVEFDHHANGHFFQDNNTFELPHFHGPRGEHFTY